MKRRVKRLRQSKKKWVTVNDCMQKGYRYKLTDPVGRNFDPEFKPELTPAEMIALGVFCGKYMTDCRKEFPASWFKKAKLSPKGRDCSLNYFGVDASRPLSEWRLKGWLHDDDPRGWFQWYCRYYMGRRMPEEDRRQIRVDHALLHDRSCLVHHADRCLLQRHVQSNIIFHCRSPSLRGHIRLASYVPEELIPCALSGSIPELPHVAKRFWVP